MSAPLNRQNLPENPTADDILNVFLDHSDHLRGAAWQDDVFSREADQLGEAWRQSVKD